MKKLLCAVMLLLPTFCIAQEPPPIPRMVSYQGYLTRQGTPVSGDIVIELHLYDAQTNGTVKWSKKFDQVPVSRGYYTVLMDFSQNWTNGAADFHGQFWLDATVDGKSLGRVQMTGAPFAVNAIWADTAKVAVKLVQDAPIGTVIAYAGQAFGIPEQQASGWYICDGSLISTSVFPDYRRAVGSIYGTNANGDSVYLPDLRGMFLRGVNGSRNDAFADPDKESRVALNGHGLAGNQIGSVQSDAFQGHVHNSVEAGGWLRLQANPQSNPISAYGIYDAGGTNTEHSDNVGTGLPADPNALGKSKAEWKAFGNPRTASETRPKNAYVYWLIKVK